MAKRRARRTTDRIKKEYEKNLGESMHDTINRLRTRVSYRDRVIERLRGKVKELEEQRIKEVREVSKLKNREIRKRDTVIRNLKKKEEEKRKREGRKFKRSIVYKNRWKEFEPSPYILNLKQSIEKASKQPKTRKDIYETIQKTIFYINKYNEENNTNLTIESVIALISFFLIDDVRGVMVTRHRLYGLSPHKVRKTINDLVKADLVTKKSVWYNINLRGQMFIEGLENHIIKGKSEIIKLLKDE